MNRNLKILLLEDNSGDALLMDELLQECSVQCSIVRANRLSAALELLGKEAFDLVLMDLNLPDSSGPETFQRIISERPGQPVIILSGSVPERMLEQLRVVGARHMLRKGYISLERLCGAVEEALTEEGGALEDEN